MKKIKVIGFDMDHTIVRYRTENFESFAYERVKEKLIQIKKYPEIILKLKWDYGRFIHGLVLDKPRGNTLKLSTHSKVKQCYHGTKPLEFKEQQRLYSGHSIDFIDSSFLALDTNFSTSHGILFSQLVDVKDDGHNLPDYETICKDIKEVLDIAHQDGTLKNEVKENLEQYIIIDPNIAMTLEKFKKYGKQLLIITNSEYDYTNFLLSSTIDPYLKDHSSWKELFDYTITNSLKPRFFYDKNRFLKVDPVTGMMSNIEGKLPPGIYQGGNAKQLEADMGHEGDEILYFGDHIYGDVVSIKKSMNWRTALVLDDLEKEIKAFKRAKLYLESIDEMMEEKENRERHINNLYKEHVEEGAELDLREKERVYSEIEKIDKNISDNITQYRKFFNPYWGEISRAGQEESRFAGQVEKYACIYMTRISDLLDYSPRTYFRPQNRPLPHELII